MIVFMKKHAIPLQENIVLLGLIMNSRSRANCFFFSTRKLLFAHAFREFELCHGNMRIFDRFHMSVKTAHITCPAFVFFCVSIMYRDFAAFVPGAAECKI